MAWPGRGKAAEALVQASGGDDVILMQQDYYNGHSEFSGTKVQHVLHKLHAQKGAMMLWMLMMLSILYVNNDPLRPVKCVPDNAYGHVHHLRPLHTALELRLMCRADCIEIRALGCWWKWAKIILFESLPTLITSRHTVYYKVEDQTSLTCGAFWDFQVLFYNLFTCAECHGNPKNLVSHPYLSKITYILQIIIYWCCWLQLTTKMITLELNLMVTTYYTIFHIKN
jgi:hypothetical protein